ncbi:hypothetical protein [Halostagnicola sp. A-GB9-2]|uniref:hypothetical protein n=1 Tax=Halostagnicola sp. A-GB9-2 TaxID=3048066 RepID=UPI0024BFE3BD|nr:hypothetical protein [Halostagnicola sp. A-GB9-2]MDJ1431670.1 hypothetical protein [Halostagnicola sp. A-GB9-2]
MTDDSETDSVDGPTPGGGPNRVVSETSVDDILDSISSSPEPDRDDRSEKSEQTEETNRNGKTNREGDSSERDGDTEADPEPDAVGDPKPNTTTIETGPPADPSAVLAADSIDDGASANRVPGNGPDDDIVSGEAPPAEPEPETESKSTTEPALTPGSEPTTESGPTMETGPTTETENSLEDAEPDLSSRIERGEVTGSDVRAAEAGEGREETTDIGDIELSMDDLESTTGSGSSSRATRGRSSTDGPLSGSIGPSAADPETGESDETKDSETDEGPSGLFDRLKGLFSR